MNDLPTTLFILMLVGSSSQSWSMPDVAASSSATSARVPARGDSLKVQGQKNKGYDWREGTRALGQQVLMKRMFKESP